MVIVIVLIELLIHYLFRRSGINYNIINVNVNVRYSNYD